MRIVALVLLLATPAAADPSPEGVLCFKAPPSCHETAGTTAAVSPAAEERTYVWRRAGGAEIALGTVPSGASDVTWPKRSVALKVRDQGQTNQPKEIAIEVTGAAKRWELVVRPREAAALTRLFLMDGPHTLTANAAHRQPARIQISGEERVAYEVTLLPRPVISGRVVDRKTRKGIVGAVVTALPAEASVAVTDFSGNFAFETADEWPSSLRIQAAAYGAKLVPAPVARTTTALPWVELSPAGALLLSVRHDADVEAELASPSEEGQSTPIAVKVIRPAEGSVRFDDLDEGEYELRLRGAGPFERYTTTVTVKAEQTTTETIELAPVPLDLYVTRDTRGVPAAKIEVKHFDPRWQTDVTTDLGGHARGTLWQQGLFVAFVTTPGAGGTQIVRKALSGVNEIEWRIALEGGVVAGVVTDAREKFPVARATVSLKTKKGSGTQELTAVTNEQGEFRFAYVPEGSQVLSAHMTGYSSAEKTFELSPDVRERHLKVELVPADVLRLRVLNSYGVPLVGATIADNSGAVQARWVTDADGRAAIPVRRGESRTFFVLPREGSIGVSTIATPGNHEELAEQQIIVPRGEVTVDIRTQSASGDAVPDVALLLRHNGVVVPERVAQLMFQLHGNMLQTGKSGSTQLRNLPVGSYEFWPYFSLAEFQQLNRGPLSAGTALVATPGTNSIVLTFAGRAGQ